MKLTPLSKAFGADITGVRLGSLSDASFEDIYGAWLEYGVLRFRQQSLTKDDLQAFSHRFGPVPLVGSKLRNDILGQYERAVAACLMVCPHFSNLLVEICIIPTHPLQFAFPRATG